MNQPNDQTAKRNDHESHDSRERQRHFERGVVSDLEIEGHLVLAGDRKQSRQILSQWRLVADLRERELLALQLVVFNADYRRIAETGVHGKIDVNALRESNFLRCLVVVREVKAGSAEVVHIVRRADLARNVLG